MPSSSSDHEGSREWVKHWAEGVCLIGLLVLAAWFFFWTATSAGSPLTFERPAYDLYNRLADGFLAGRTSFLEEPPIELAQLANPYDPVQNAPYKKYHDVTYYQGRYYLYFGPTPALVLLAPWKLLTGSSLPQNLAVAVFAWGTATLSVLLLLELRRHYFPEIRSWLLIALAHAVVLGSLLPVLLRRPLHYELAIACACFFGLAAVWCFFRALSQGRYHSWWWAVAGLSLGLAVAARPNYLFGAGAAIMVCLGVWWRSTETEETPQRILRLGRSSAYLLVPFAFCIFGLLAYNYARFGNIFEFGTSYMLAGSNQTGASQLGLRYLPINFYYHLLAPWHLSVYFPFVLVTGMPPFTAPIGYSGQENMYGLALSLPFLWSLWWVWVRIRRGAPQSSWQLWARIAGALAIGNLAFLLLLMGAANRYQLDYVPPLMVLAVLGVMKAETMFSGWRKWLVRTGWLAALIWTLIFNVMVSLQHNELLRYHNPATYRKLAYMANHWSQWWPSGESGPLRIELNFPKDRTGKLEPLLVTGASFRADFLYIFYKDDTHIQIGFEHTSYGGPMSPPLEVDYELPHVLEVQLGSLYPPLEHPYYAEKTSEEINRLKRTLLIKLDGRVVHSGQYDFYDSSPGDVTVGRNPVSEAFGRRFTGVVQRVTRPASIE